VIRAHLTRRHIAAFLMTIACAVIGVRRAQGLCVRFDFKDMWV
jgi:hypothetical protein